ncbi:MAG: hypothetical protein WCF85_03110 [Rhodospirillaceae bacterium]
MDNDIKSLLALLLAKVEGIQAGQIAMRADIAELQVGQKALQAGQIAVRADIAELQAGQDSLRTDVAVLQSGMEELRRVTSTNHFKTIGQIERLSDQFTRHLVEHHGQPAMPPQPEGRGHA